MPIKLQGKEYKLVSERLVALREMWPDATITTHPHITQTGVIMTAHIEVDGRKSTGHSYCDMRGDKALERSETVAVGRALSFLHPDLMGGQIASAEEITEFNYGKAKKEVELKYRNYGFALQEHWDSCTAIRQYLDDGELAAAWEAWNEIPEQDRQALRIAATKGGWLTVEQSKRLGEASNQDFDADAGVYRSIAERADNE